MWHLYVCIVNCSTQTHASLTVGRPILELLIDPTMPLRQVLFSGSIALRWMCYTEPVPSLSYVVTWYSFFLVLSQFRLLFILFVQVTERGIKTSSQTPSSSGQIKFSRDQSSVRGLETSFRLYHLGYRHETDLSKSQPFYHLSSIVWPKQSMLTRVVLLAPHTCKSQWWH